MSTTTESSATANGAANSDSALVGEPDEAAAGQQPIDAEKVHKAVSLVGLEKVAAILKQRRDELAAAKTQLAELTTDKAGLEAGIAAKDEELANNQQQIGALQTDLDVTTADKLALESQLAEIEAQLNQLGLEYGPAEVAPAAERAEGEDIDLAAGESAPPATGMTVAGLGALLKSKNDALQEALAQVDALQAEIANQAVTIDGLNQQIGDLQADLDATTATKTELEGQMSEIETRLGRIMAEFGAEDDAEPAPDASTETAGAASTEPTTEETA